MDRDCTIWVQWKIEPACLESSNIHRLHSNPLFEQCLQGPRDCGPCLFNRKFAILGSATALLDGAWSPLQSFLFYVCSILFPYYWFILVHISCIKRKWTSIVSSLLVGWIVGGFDWFDTIFFTWSQLLELLIFSVGIVVWGKISTISMFPAFIWLVLNIW